MPQPRPLASTVRPLSLLGLLAVLSAAEPAPIEVVGGSWGMFTEGEQPELVITAAPGTRVTLTATDAWGVPTAWSHTATLTAGELRIPGPSDLGYHRIDMKMGDTDVVTDVAVVLRQPPGSRPDSFFASNTSQMRLGKQLALLNRIGMRVQRTHFQGSAKVTGPADGSAVQMDFGVLDRRWKEVRESGSWVLPICAYSVADGANSAEGVRLRMHGPPRDFAEFTATWAMIVKRYPEIRTWEFWNEPWIYGWTWAASPAAYRDLQTQFGTMMREVDPELRVLAGHSSMFAEDHIEPHPESWRGLIDGISHHPYSETEEASMRPGGQGRSIDHGALINRRMGLDAYYLTEGGTKVKVDGSPRNPQNNGENACKVVNYHLRAALAGAVQANIQWDIGYGPAWTLPNALYATMAHMLEDRPCLADLWPHHELLWGGIFADPQHVDDAVRALPRSSELRARWSIATPPERAADGVKVALIQALTGVNNDTLDTTGQLIIDAIDGLTAYDATGREILPANGVLTVPFGVWPVYILSQDLSVIELHRRIANARMTGITALNAYATSLAQPADAPQTLRVRVQNQSNADIAGTLTIQADGAAAVSVACTVAAGRLAEVDVPWPGVALRSDNQYGVTVTLDWGTGRSEHRQVLATAAFVRRSITVDGDLADWAVAVPVLLDSDRLRGGVDLTQYLLNPGLEREADDGADERVVARLYTAWDDDGIHLALSVDEAELANTAGLPAQRRGGEVPFPQGIHDGLTHIRYTGDAFLFAFGFRDRVPGVGRQLDDPWAWKGHFHDTDYQYVAHTSTDGPQLIRLTGPDTPRRTPYQTVREAWVGPVAGARLAIVRDQAQGRTIYEMTLPRSEIHLFDPATGSLRFGFQLITDKPVNGSKVLTWAEAAGVFDHWRGSGSFSPSWETTLPCQTFFGISP